MSEPITLDAGPEIAARARMVLTDRIRLDPIRLYEAQLLITELVSNAIKHGAAKELLFSVTQEATGWRVELSHSAAADLELVEHGFGFNLLDRLARRWGHTWKNRLLTVWFEIRPAGIGGDLADLDDSQVLVGSLDDPLLREEAVRRFSRMATGLARRFRGKGIADSDLEQVAMLGLINAINRFDANKGVFEAFAIATITGELKRHLRDRAWSVRVPRGLKELTLRVGQATGQLSQTLGRRPHPSELAEYLEISQEAVLEAIGANSAYHWDSLIEPDPETGLVPADALAGDLNMGLPADESVELSGAMAQLPERERQIVYLRFFADLTQTEIAGRMGISQMHVSRLLAHGLARLRTLMG